MMGEAAKTQRKASGVSAITCGSIVKTDTMGSAKSKMMIKSVRLKRQRILSKTERFL